MECKAKEPRSGQLVGIVHPGMMGIFVAASIIASGYEVFWASEGRSPATKERAEQYGLQDLGDLPSLCQQCEVLISVCPPHAAFEVAKQVINCSFKGTYLDANAISPHKAEAIADLMQRAGTAFVDGGIIGGPDWEKGRTRLYLSGGKAKELTLFFAGGLLQTSSIGDDVGRASALKMCYAAYTKGTTALLAAIFALAEDHHVRGELAARWEEDWPGLYSESSVRIGRGAVKAWRFEGEMKEIAETFSKAGLPGDFHEGASKVYKRLSEYKNIAQLIDVETILNTLLKG